MKCLVTGASGFIGNALVHRLSDQGHQVIGLIHQNQPPKKHPNATYIKDDIVHPGEKLKHTFKKVNVVFHCAAYVKDYGPKKMFYKINVEGTKNLVDMSFGSVDRFIYLSHIPYEKATLTNYYNKTKSITESYLLKKFNDEDFPVVIIRPGNVYGPGATTWVERPLESIRNDRIALVNNGLGIFLHTYIDNLIDALLLASDKENIDGECIEITDGDYSISWGDYLNDLASIIDKKSIERNISKSTALFIGRVMITFHKLFGIKPWVTPQAVETFTNQHQVSIEKAKTLLGYSPKIDYEQGIKHVKEWVKENKQYLLKNQE